MFAPIGKNLPLVIPTKEQIKLLPLFPVLGPERITLVSTAREAERACTELVGAKFCGFDTESKALFRRGEVSDGPHLIQVATLERAWVIQLHDFDTRSMILQWLRGGNVTKAGFGLHYDCGQIARQFKVKLEGILELNAEFRKRGFPREVGAITAVALLFEQRFVKSKATAKSDWSRRWLSNAQLLYAANDAYVAAVVYNALLSRGATGPTS